MRVGPLDKPLRLFYSVWLKATAWEPKTEALGTRDFWSEEGMGHLEGWQDGCEVAVQIGSRDHVDQWTVPSPTCGLPSLG